MGNGTQSLFSERINTLLSKKKISNTDILRASFSRNLTVVHVVSHTHWNREKYLPQIVLRGKLVNVFEEIFLVFSH
jgi:hypothetical protein